ncbi:helix-turn-helix transcriptional regulator [Pedobacter cryoconitis]|uniref:AraC-like DNA-binding protein n=1 Tax=Pedobacter cryoconitis TaxID=188932 RepID=A0A7X0J145_9SPHI|nr:helix-turn-helix transcriptional regulator [Pedobacter cryoconitis]MBB6498759.1 AraC-like DNA-binding protein [Pedobacter cryoconitis]
MNISFFSPSTELKPYIDRYWSWDNNGEQNEVYMPVIPPATGIELFIHHKDPFVIDHKGKLSPDVLFFSSLTSSAILPSQNVGFVAVRFRAGMFRHFTDIPLAELNGHFINMQNIWGHQGKEVFEKISNCVPLSDKICILEKFLTNRLAMNNNINPLWDHVINELYKSEGDIVSARFSKYLNISYRHFRRKFIEQTGIAPKQFQQLSRFHATIKPLLLTGNKKYLTVALDNSYFDQNHFIKEFKQYMQVTPSVFLQEKNFRSHFYYPRV